MVDLINEDVLLFESAGEDGPIQKLWVPQNWRLQFELWRLRFHLKALKALEAEQEASTNLLIQRMPALKLET